MWGWNRGHRWRQPAVLPATQFAAWAADVCAVIAALPVEMIRGVDGEGDPVITADLIAFSGNRRYRVSWDDDPIAVYRDPARLAAYRTDDAVDHDARSGFRIARVVDRRAIVPEDDESFAGNIAADDLPIDIAAVAALILFAAHFGDIVGVFSDHCTDHWLPGLALAERLTGRALSFPHRVHGWIRPLTFPIEGFAAWKDDVARVIAAADCPITGPDGTGPPVLTDALVAFNAPRGDGYRPLRLSREYDPALGEWRMGMGDWFLGTLRTTRDGGTGYDAVVTATLILLKYRSPASPCSTSNRSGRSARSASGATRATRGGCRGSPSPGGRRACVWRSRDAGDSSHEADAPTHLGTPVCAVPDPPTTPHPVASTVNRGPRPYVGEAGNGPLWFFTRWLASRKTIRGTAPAVRGTVSVQRCSWSSTMPMRRDALLWQPMRILRRRSDAAIIFIPRRTERLRAIANDASGPLGWKKTFPGRCIVATSRAGMAISATVG